MRCLNFIASDPNGRLKRKECEKLLGEAVAMGGQRGGPRLDRPAYLRTSLGSAREGGGAKKESLEPQISPVRVRIPPKEVGEPPSVATAAAPHEFAC